jgi:hypothetical protein
MSTMITITEDMLRDSGALKYVLRRDGRWALSEAIEAAALALTFPIAHSADALRVSARVIVAASEGKTDTLEAMVQEITRLRTMGQW